MIRLRVFLDHLCICKVLLPIATGLFCSVDMHFCGVRERGHRGTGLGWHACGPANSKSHSVWGFRSWEKRRGMVWDGIGWAGVFFACLFFGAVRLAA